MHLVCSYILFKKTKSSVFASVFMKKTLILHPIAEKALRKPLHPYPYV